MIVRECESESLKEHRTLPPATLMNASTGKSLPFVLRFFIRSGGWIGLVSNRLTISVIMRGDQVLSDRI